MFSSYKEFICETVNNISRFVEDEDYSTDIEERFNIPWRMLIKKENEYFQFCLRCEKEDCENIKWSIDAEFTLKLISYNGKSFTKTGIYSFEKPEANGWNKFISWKELEGDYVVDDSIVVEAHVKIIRIIDSPCIENKNQKTFLLNHTVRNVSNIKDGEDYYTKTEKRFNIPWKLNIERKNGFFGLYLCCEKEKSNRRNWAIEVDYTLKVVSVNGQSLSFEGPQRTFNKPNGYGRVKVIRWDDMLKKYMVNDSIIIEAHVKITKMTGCEEETSIDDLEDDFSECVINVGGKNYTVKRQ